MSSLSPLSFAPRPTDATDARTPGTILRDGEPHQMISGALHYFRVPHQMWADRLRRLAAMGCNTVETYVAWNFHQPYAGRLAHFGGDRNLGAFLDLAADLDLDVLVRPGPFICAEWDFGGLPSWLLAEKDLAPERLRTCDPAFLAHVDAWFDTLLPIIVSRQPSQGGRVVAVQVENEYGSFGNDADYLAHLRAGLLSRGVEVPLFTSDGPGPLWLAGGTLPDVWATVNFGSRQEQAFAELEKFRPGSPAVCMEFWNGWFDHWGTRHHVRDGAEVADELRGMLTGGRSVNFYMAHGGTNFGVWAGANTTDDGPAVQYQPTVTSYDYDSPIAEHGGLTPKFWAFRKVITAHTGRRLPDPPPDAPRLPAQQVPIMLSRSLGQAFAAHRLRDAKTPESFEQLGLHHGVLRYRTRLPDLQGEFTLRLDGLADLATVYLDDVVVARLARTVIDESHASECRLTLDGPAVLDIDVQSLGRVNFGRHLFDPKGLRGARLDFQHLHGWEQYGIDLTETYQVAWGAAVLPTALDGAGFHRAEILVTTPADGFLALPGWGRGYVFLNGVNLGRYWNAAGPQVTLYAPAPWWRAGVNEVVVCEFESPGSTIEVRDTPDLGPVEHFHPGAD
ncbi:MAG: glycoside hydrolase family 35 protein [Propionibacteriaceae bacterium]